MEAKVINRSAVEVAFEAGPGPKRIGLILLATDHTSERDFARIAPRDAVAVYAARVAYENPTTPENLRRMQPRLAEAARLILPEERLDAICYCCTAASMVLGDDAVVAAVQEGKPGVPVVTPALAGRVGLETVGARRISVLTPYLPETSASVVSYFAGHGFEVLNLDCLGIEDDRRMARVTADTIIAAAERAVAPEADALFISCTALRAAELVQEIEARIGRPVVTSNQASIWLALRYAGIARPIEGHGRLMLAPAPDRAATPQSGRSAAPPARPGAPVEAKAGDGSITLADIEDARARIAPHIRRTPMQPSPSLSALAGAAVHLKLEQHQITGSFKLRGATNAILDLSEAQRARGVVGASTGNHGRGLAYAARAAGVRAVICMSRLVPRNKVDGIRALGAEIRIVGESQDDAQLEVDRLVAEEGMTMVPPFDHPGVIAGQGTLGLEILEELPEVRTVVVPLSGGGLIAGVARAVKAADPAIRMVGVTMERGAAMYRSQKAGKPVPVKELPTLADSLGGGIGLDNHYTFAMVRELVDDILLVDEPQIADAIRHAYWAEQEVVEGSGAVGIAALKAGLLRDPGVTAILLTGRNIDMALHSRIATGRPGSLPG